MMRSNCSAWSGNGGERSMAAKKKAKKKGGKKK
jgi:hypothetical protein